MLVFYPQWLYHGTTANFVQSFMDELINPRYWKTGKDFGPGFYSTIDLLQAQRWAMKLAKDNFEDPSVLQMEIVPDAVPHDVINEVFFGGKYRMGTVYFGSSNRKGRRSLSKRV